MKRRNLQQVSRSRDWRQDSTVFYGERIQVGVGLQVNDSQSRSQQRGRGGGGLGVGVEHRGRGRVQFGAGPRETRHLRSAFEPVENFQLPSSAARR